MSRLVFSLALLTLLLTPSRAGAACRWYGTQLACDTNGRPVWVGTQIAPDPTWSRSTPRPQSLTAMRDFGSSSSAASGMRIELQNFGGDATVCRMIGGERYCY